MPRPACNVSLAKTMTTSSRTRQTTTTVTPPSPQSLLDQVATGAMTPHETKISKMSLNLRQFQSHMCYLQAKLFLTTGVSGGWSEAAQELLLGWFGAKNRCRELFLEAFRDQRC